MTWKGATGVGVVESRSASRGPWVLRPAKIRAVGPEPRQRRRAGGRGGSPASARQPVQAAAGAAGGGGAPQTRELSGVRPRRVERGRTSGGGGRERASRSASATAGGSCPRGSRTPTVANSGATCCAAPGSQRPSGPPRAPRVEQPRRRPCRYRARGCGLTAARGGRGPAARGPGRGLRGRQ